MKLPSWIYNRDFLNILGVIIVIAILALLSSITTCNTDIKSVEKEAILKTKIEQLEKELKYSESIIDSLSKKIAQSDTEVVRKKENIKLIKPKYDKKIKSITTSSADTISSYVLNRYR